MKLSIEPLKQRLRSHSFLTSIFVLAGGTAIGQGLVVLASPLLTRLYTPEDFGMLGIYTSILALLVVVASLRYELAIPLPEDDEIAANLMILSILIVFCMSVLSGVIVWLLGDQVILWVNAPALKPYLWLLPLGLLGAGVYQVLNYWAVRRKSFGLIARTKLSQSIGMVFTQIGLGLLKVGPVGLLLGQVMGQASGSTTLATLAWRQDREAIGKASVKGLRWAAYRYRRFPILSSSSSLLNSAGLHLPLLLLASFYGPQVAGWFALGQRIIGIPMSLVGQAVAQVYIGEASHLARHDPQAVHNVFLKVAQRLLIYGLIPICLLAVCGSWLFGLAFGHDWIESGKYIQILAFMFLIQLVVVPLSQTLNILERQDWQLAWDASRLVLVVGGIILVGVLGFSAWHAVTIYGVTMSIAYIGLFIISNIAIVKRVSEVGKA